MYPPSTENLLISPSALPALHTFAKMWCLTVLPHLAMIELLLAGKNYLKVFYLSISLMGLLDAFPTEGLRALHTEANLVRQKRGQSTLGETIQLLQKVEDFSDTGCFSEHSVTLLSSAGKRHLSERGIRNKNIHLQSKITEPWRGERFQLYSYPTSSGFS